MDAALAGGDVGRRDHGDHPGHLRLPAARPGYLEAVKAAVRAARHAVHRRRGADRADAHRRDVGHHQARHRAGHPGHRQGPVRRHVPDRRRAGQRAVRGLADRGRLRAHVQLRRRRARLRGRAEDPGDLQPPGDPVDGALHRRPDRPRAARHPGQLSRTGSPASGRTAWSWAWSSTTRKGAKYVMRHLYRTRGVGHLLDAGPAGAAVQAGPADDARAVRGTAGATEAGIGGALRRSARREPGRGARPVRRPARGAAARPPRRTAAPAADAGQRAHWAARRVRRATTGPPCCASPRRSRPPRTRRPAGTPSGRSSETGFGVAEHKIIKNEACSLGIFERYRDEDYVSPRIDPDSQDRRRCPGRPA